MNKTFQIIEVILLAAALIIAYLFALNGRYIKMHEWDVFDKCTQEPVWIER